MLNISKLLRLDKPFILASNSPRRQLLLNMLGLEFSVFPSKIAEDKSTFTNPEEFVCRLSYEKALYVARQQELNSIVLGADTIVVLNGELLGKPKDKADAFRILQKLSLETGVMIS